MTEIFDDIRQIYRFSKPCEPLQPYIEFFSESSADATALHTDGAPFNVRMFASYTPTIWLNLGPAYRLNINNRIRSIKAGEDVLIIRDGMTERLNQPTDHIFTIKFFPGGMQAILGISQQTMAGRIIPLHQILPQGLITRMKTLKSFEERLHYIQQSLLASMLQHTPPDHYVSLVQKTIAHYTDSGLQYNISQAAGHSFVTSRTINRYFNRVIGASPKQYLSIMRARIALTKYVQDKAAFEPTQYGYYDASHFHKEILKFAGQLPGRLQA